MGNQYKIETLITKKEKRRKSREKGKIAQKNGNSNLFILETCTNMAFYLR